MQNDHTTLRIVRIMEPSLCVSCRHAAIATVVMGDGSSRRMMHCKRFDCDNWQTVDTDEEPQRILEAGQ